MMAGGERGRRDGTGPARGADRAANGAAGPEGGPGAYDVVIGLEVHVQLDTATKLFCADAVEYGAEPNSHVCPVCLGLPGALPVLNRRAVELGARAALGLGCTVRETSVFARKNYFYPDLPKGYQITQFERPLAAGGALEWDRAGGSRPAPGRVRIRRVHLEEDAGKSIHDRVPGATAVDLNRAGVPLIEIVTEPDLRSAADARSFLVALKRLLEYLEVSDCDMEKGSLRVDANISLRRGVDAPPGTKTEIKNMNSFANVERALEREAVRQESLLEAGRPVVHETMLWDEVAGDVRVMRSKEMSHDYRYFPEPDLPPLVLERAWIERLAEMLPESPRARRLRLVRERDLPEYDADVLTASRALADYFEAVCAAGAPPKAASNWVMTEVLGWMNREGVDDPGPLPIPPDGLAELIGLVEDHTISTSIAREVFSRMAEGGQRPSAIVEAGGLAQVRDADQLEAWAREAVRTHPDAVERYRGGEARLLGFFMGQIMKASEGKADPQRASRILRTLLDG